LSAGRVPDELRARVRAASGDRCGYCLARQEYVLGQLEIEHIVPRARGGTNDEDNLWLSCSLCNTFKGAPTHGTDPASGRPVPLFNPRRQRWDEHFEWGDGGLHIVGISECGRATVLVLRLNNAIAIAVRRAWIAAGWHPPAPGRGK
jgi:HNH endonuclease